MGELSCDDPKMRSLTKPPRKVTRELGFLEACKIARNNHEPFLASAGRAYIASYSRL